MKVKLHLRIITVLSFLIPRRFRSDWAEEWKTELRYRETKTGRDLIRPSLGAFWDAIALQSRRLEEEFWQDVQYGVRTFVGSKAVAGAVIVSLALGIGVNAALFSLIDPLLFKKLPVRNPDELLMFQWTKPYEEKSYLAGTLSESRHSSKEEDSDAGGVFSASVFEQFKKGSTTLAEIFAFSRLSPTSAIVDGNAEIISGQWVSGGYFRSLGIGAAGGRTLVDSDDQKASTPVAMLGHQYWSRRFNGERDVLGRTIRIGGASFTIVGIAPPGFDGTLQVDDAPDVYLPLSSASRLTGKAPWQDEPYWWWVWIMARPKPGMNATRIHDELEPVFQQAALEGFQKAIADGAMVGVGPVSERTPPQLKVVSGSRGLLDNRDTYRPALRILGALTLLVLLIACVNVANLLLSRATTRQQEIAIRVALGAGRLRLVRQLLTESLLLAVCGGVVGIAAASYAGSFLLQWGPWNASASNISTKLDWRVFVFTAVLTLLASVLSGVVPAAIATRKGLSATMRAHARTMSRSSRIGELLLGAQAAMAVMLLIGAGLFVATVYNLRGRVVVEDPARLLQFSVDAIEGNYGRDRTVALADDVLARVKAVPGVKSATVLGMFGLNPQGYTEPVSGRSGAVYKNAVGSGFFQTLGIPILAGRGLESSDANSAEKVVVINEALAKKFFPNESPLGKDVEGIVVGVARDVDYRELRKQPMAGSYSVYRQPANARFMSRMTFHVRTGGDPMQILPSIRTAIRELDPQIALTDVRTMAEQIDKLIATENLFARISTLFGGMALLLTSIGLFGVLSYSVAGRTKEFGVHLAMGARPGYLMGRVIRDGVLIVLVGVAVGVVVAGFAARYIASLLYGLVPHNPFVMAGAVAVVIGVALAASFMPARRASRVAPIDALRYE